MPNTRSAAMSGPSSAAATATAKISFRSRKIVKKPPVKPVTAAPAPSPALPIDPLNLATVPSPAPPVPVLPTLSSPGELATALSHLRAADPLLAAVIDSTDAPTFISSPSLPAFHSLARSILYQQLATSAADAIYARFLALLASSSAAAAAEASDGAVNPADVLALAAADLRAIGVSGRKAAYLHDLAAKFAAGDLSESAVAAFDEAALLTELTKVKGIGEWTVHMFMIFSLHRPDVLPSGDLGVRKGVQELYKLRALPNPEEMAALCQRWRPYRSVGAWYMWRLMESKGAAAKKAKKGNATS